MSRRILVLESDPAVGRDIRRILGSAGYLVYTMGRGRDALSRIRGEDFDLVVTGAQLPDMSGLEVLREAKRFKPDLDVVVLAAERDPGAARAAEDAGALEYLASPVTPEQMLNVAARVFDRERWRQRRTFMDSLKGYITPVDEVDEASLRYEGGVWARPQGEGRWEIGMDLRHWYLSEGLLCVEVPEQAVVASGEPFARLRVAEERAEDLISPVGGVVVQSNVRANEAMCFLAKENLSEGWMLWLIRVRDRRYGGPRAATPPA